MAEPEYDYESWENEGPNHPSIYLGDLLVVDGNELVYLDGTRRPWTKGGYDQLVEELIEAGYGSKQVEIATGEDWDQALADEINKDPI